MSRSSRAMPEWLRVVLSTRLGRQVRPARPRRRRPSARAPRSGLPTSLAASARCRRASPGGTIPAATAVPPSATKSATRDRANDGLKCPRCLNIDDLLLLDPPTIRVGAQDLLKGGGSWLRGRDWVTFPELHQTCG